MTDLCYKGPLNPFCYSGSCDDEDDQYQEDFSSESIVVAMTLPAGLLSPSSTQGSKSSLKSNAANNDFKRSYDTPYDSSLELATLMTKLEIERGHKAEISVPFSATRCLEIFGVTRQNIASLTPYLANFGDIKFTRANTLQSMASCQVEYYDIRHAWSALLNLRNFPQLSVNFVAPSGLSSLSRICKVDGTLSGKSFRALQNFGEIRFWNCEIRAGSYICDYYDTRAAQRAVRTLGDFILCENDETESCTTSISRFTTSNINQSKATSLVDTSNFKESLKNGSLDFSLLPDKQDLSKCIYNIKLSTVVTKADVPRNNRVDLKRISLGEDTRTTLMLRNIPNKVDQQMLKEYIDVSNKNTYDFLCERTKEIDS